MQTCIAYFSKTGNTKMAVEHLAEKIGATLIELNDTTNYKGFIGFMKGGMNASIRKAAKLDQTLFKKIAKSDRFTRPTPVGGGKKTPAINAVLTHVDLHGKQVYVITTQADPQCKDAQKRKDFYCTAIEAKNGTFVELYTLYGASPGAVASREEMNQRVDVAIDLK
jgi:hypothetical protein